MSSFYGDMMFKICFCFFSFQLICFVFTLAKFIHVQFSLLEPGGLYSSTLFRPCLISVLGLGIGFLFLWYFAVTLIVFQRQSGYRLKWICRAANKLADAVAYMAMRKRLPA